MIFRILILFSIVLVSCNVDDKNINKDQLLFTLLDPVKTGVNFNNTINDKEISAFEYVNIYNGGGVALGDINNDGLTDVFLTANQGPDKLFLNKGSMQFEDISKSAGIEGNEGWSSGVVMADVNGDSYLDIYVCKAINDEFPELRKNQLFINQKDNTFIEMASEYGVDDASLTNHATFFDYDKDGDLDLYVANHPRNWDGQLLAYLIEKKQNPIFEESDHFYRNNGDQTFDEVTEEVGLLNYGWTLGVAISDYDNDGWEDIYTPVDHHGPDLFFKNNGDGTFTNIIDKAIKHTCNFSMGLDIADFNNDGHVDIMNVDMAPEDNFREKTQMKGMMPGAFWAMVKVGFHYQYMRNVLQLNNGNGSFSDIGIMAGVDKTDWSWAPLLADFDNDGWKDLYVTNGYKVNWKDNDLMIEMKKINEKRTAQGLPLYSGSDWKNVVELDSTKITNYYFTNNKDLSFTKASKESGFNEISFSNGAAYGDLDNDGDLDLVINNINDPAFIYKNNTNERSKNSFIRFKLKGPESNSYGIGTKILIKYNDEIQFQEMQLSHGFQSSVEPIIHFGLGQGTSVDSVIIDWPYGEREVLISPVLGKEYVVDYKNAKDISNNFSTRNLEPKLFSEVSKEIGLDFKHQENDYNDYDYQVLLPHKLSQFGPAITVGDINKDGLDDVFIGGGTGQVGSMYKQLTNGTFVEYNCPALKQDAGFEDVAALLFDADNDGDDDLYVASGGNFREQNSPLFLHDRLYINNDGDFVRTDAIPKLFTSGSCVEAGDYDNDGDLDLFVGGRHYPKFYPSPCKSHILRNDNGVFIDVTNEVCTNLVNPGMITSASWSDFNQDGNLDLVTVGEWMNVDFYINTGKGFDKVTEEKGLGNSNGWWNRIAPVDLDNDGDLDFIVGNLGLNYKYKTSKEEPFQIYAKDFDKNNKFDIVLSYYNGGELYPVRGRQCSSEQLPKIKSKFPSYKEYASASVIDVYGEDLQDAIHYKAYEFASSYLINDGNGNYKTKALPFEVQKSPINGIITDDFDGDGNVDVLLSGNFYVSEVETGRADAGTGNFLKGDGKGGFDPINLLESGFVADKDVRNMVSLNAADGSKLILVANNNDFIQAYRVNAVKK